MDLDGILTVVFAIMLTGHGVAHAVASFHLVGQIGGRVKADALPVGSWLLPNLRPRGAAALALAFWLPASVGFLLSVLPMLDIALASWPWQSIIVASAVLSTLGIAVFTGIWPGGEARLRSLHVGLAMSMNILILVTQLFLGWPD
jgi:hypothetical protein